MPLINEDENSVETFDPVESNIETGRYRWLDIITKRWSFLLENTLYEKLGVMFNVYSEPSEGMRFSKFMDQAKQQKPIYIFETEMLHGKGLVLVSNSFAQCCLQSTVKERMKVQNEELPDLNPKKQAVIENVLKEVVGDFSRSWEGIAQVQINLKKITTHPFRARVMAPFERCLVSKMTFVSDGFKTDLTVCFSYLTLDKILLSLDKKKVLAPEIIDHSYPEVKSHFEQALKENVYKLTAEIGTLNVCQKDNYKIKVGDSYPLENALGSSISLKINGQNLFSAELGESDGIFAAKVNGLFETSLKEFRNRPRTFKHLQWQADR